LKTGVFFRFVARMRRSIEKELLPWEWKQLQPSRQKWISMLPFT
jgi:hypothetical protein